MQAGICQLFNPQILRTMQVFNLTSNRSGKAVANQYCVIMDDGTRFFRSYAANICKIEPDGTITLDEYYWNYSRTTAKYLRQFLQMTSDQIQNKMVCGEIKMSNLN